MKYREYKLYSILEKLIIKQVCLIPPLLIDTPEIDEFFHKMFGSPYMVCTVTNYFHFIRKENTKYPVFRIKDMNIHKISYYGLYIKQCKIIYQKYYRGNVDMKQDITLKTIFDEHGIEYNLEKILFRLL